MQVASESGKFGGAGMAVFGDTLRQARAYKGVTLKEAEQATRINRHHLAALEDENFAVLPPLIYQRGIIRNYANYLELDPGKLLALFDEARGAEATNDLVAAVRPLEMPNHWAPNFAIIAFMVVMSAVVFAWAYSAYFAPPGESETATSVVPTVTAIADEDLALSSPTAVVLDSAAIPDLAETPPSAASATLPPTATVASDIPTITPIPVPTSTPIPQPTATVPAAPVVQPTPVPPEVEAPPPPAPTADQMAITFTATDWIYLSVTADGAPVYEGDLAPGLTTEVFYGQSFSVYTSNIGATSITRDGGSPFVMGYEANEATFSLP